jgi:SpoVK/Ycf46/Vps4 family AAA+-type ATPase
MGETAAKLRLIFDAITNTRAVYLFDEFDSIGSERGLSNDVGEIRRVVNSFLQMVEQDASDSIIIAATNHAAILDKALFRRFDDIIHYALPTQKQAEVQLKSKLANFISGRFAWTVMAKAAAGLSYGDIARATEDAIKHAIIEKHPISKDDLLAAIVERRSASTVTKPKPKRKQQQ